MIFCVFTWYVNDIILFIFFFFKQKTAYEIPLCDWSSDVCSSDLGREIRAAARVVVNATGAFCDGVRHLADPTAAPLVSPSQGTHLVFDHSVLPGDSALLVPKTPDGRVLFAIPWHGHTLVGTTDVAIPEAALEPRPTEQ